jgi:hypothetical protein
MITKIYILLFVHYLSDFLLQSRYMAKFKSTKMIELLKHFTIIFVCFVAGTQSFWLPFVYALAHCLQDRYIWKLYGWSRKTNLVHYYDDYVFWNFVGADQLLHVLVLFFIFI